MVTAVRPLNIIIIIIIIIIIMNIDIPSVQEHCYQRGPVIIT